MVTHGVEPRCESREAWLKRLEAAIDLPSYLGQRGYEVQGATAEGIRMAHAATGDTLVVRTSGRGGWTYANVNDSQDRGSVCEFIMRRDRVSLDQAAGRIIVLADPHSRDAEAARYRHSLHGSALLREAKRGHQQALELANGTVTILEKVGIPRGTLDEWRFGPVKTPDALAKLMADPKDLWASRYRPTDKHVVFTEQPIDAIAFEKVRGRQMSCYMATGRELTDEVRKKIAHVLCEVPQGVKVILAFGRNDRGHHLAEQVRALAPTLHMERQPPDLGSRWSTQMELEQRHARSLARTEPALGGR